jgi:hypothetical protein
MREMSEWLPVFLSFYPALHARVPTIVYGSQIIAVTQGIDVSSKDIDLLCPNVTLKAIEEAYAESSGREEMRIELIKSRRGHVFTIYYPLGERPIPIEIFTTTPLGDPLSIFPDQIVEVSRWGRRFISLTVEAYAVLEAARGIRPISVERLRGIRIEWDEVERLGEKFGLKEEVLRLKREVGIG